MILRTLYIALCSLLFAGIVHIAIILLIPEYGTQDAWSTLSKKTDLWSFRAIAVDDAEEDFADVDPFFRFGTCRFDLSEAGLLMEAPKINRLWSASVFDETGTMVYSLTNRTTIENRLQLVILNPVQMLGLRELQPKIVETAIVVEANINEGFVILRVLSPDESWTEDTERFLSNISCTRYIPEADDETEEPSEEEGDAEVTQ